MTSINPLDQATLLLRSRAGLKDEPASRARLERLLQESANLAGIPVRAYVQIVDNEPAAFDDLVERHASKRQSAEAAEGLASFAEKRSARWKPI